jgi:hypothetical protein
MKTKIFFSDIRPGMDFTGEVPKETEDYKWAKVSMQVSNGITVEPPITLGWNNFEGLTNEDLGKPVAEVYKGKITNDDLLEEWVSDPRLLLENGTPRVVINNEGKEEYVVALRFMPKEGASRRNKREDLQEAGRQQAASLVNNQPGNNVEGDTTAKPEVMAES